MTTTGEVALSYQLALTNQLDITANNIANVTTPGFQSSHPLFVEFLVEVDETGEEIAYVVDEGTVRNLNPGPVNFTGNPLDISIEGRGYFVVETADGIFYSRNGAFQLDSAGQLITSSGAATPSLGLYLTTSEDPLLIAKLKIPFPEIAPVTSNSKRFRLYRLIEWNLTRCLRLLARCPRSGFPLAKDHCCHDMYWLLRIGRRHHRCHRSPADESRRSTRFRLIH